MFMKLFFIFAVLPILEIMLLLNVSDSIGGWNTFLLVIITAFFGAYFVRREGTQTLATVQQKLAQGEMPGKEVSEGLLLLVAGVLLVTPGFITDLIGLLFTLPITRAPIAKMLVNQFKNSKHSTVHFSAGGFHQNPHHGSPFGDSQANENEYDPFSSSHSGSHSHSDSNSHDDAYSRNHESQRYNPQNRNSFAQNTRSNNRASRSSGDVFEGEYTDTTNRSERSSSSDSSSENENNRLN